MHSLFLLIVIICFIASPSYASEAQGSLTYTVSEFSDPNEELNINSLVKKNFQLSERQIVNYGLKDHPVWIKLDLTLDHALSVHSLFLSVNFPPLDYVDIFVPKVWISDIGLTQWESTENEAYVVKKLGDMYEYHSRDIISPNFLVDFYPSSNHPNLPIYIRVKSSTNLQIPLYIFDANERAKQELTDTLVLGGYFGLMLVMILYNGFIYLTTRIPAYFYYVLFNCAMLIAQATKAGYTYQFLWPDAVWFNQHIIFVSSGLIFLFGSFFIRSFMETKALSPTLDKFFVLSAVMGAITAILAVTPLFDYAVKLSIFVGLYLPLAALTLGLLRLKAHERRAVFFVTAWGVLLISGIIWHLTLSGSLPMTYLSNYFLVIGSSVEITLLSLALADDINQQKNNAIRLEQNKKMILLERDAAEYANKAKSIFLANISHELRTPLNAIIGFSKRVVDKSKDALEPRYVDALNTVTKNGEHLLELVNNLLDLSQVESGKFTLNIQRISLNKVCQDAIEPLLEPAKSKNLSLNCLFDESLPEFMADETRMKQVVINLVNNSIKFTEKGSITITTKLDNVNEEPHAILTVTDTGVGISEEIINHIFARFQSDSTNDQVFNIEGSGLGLAVCKEIVELHGGKISVQSDIGRGTTFTVMLPTHT